MLPYSVSVEERATPAMPSREFFLQQAAYNTVSCEMPVAVRVRGMADAARWMLSLVGDELFDQHWLVKSFRKQYRGLLATYSRPQVALPSHDGRGE